MGWRSTQAAVASGAKSFAPKNSGLEEGFLTASKIIASKWMKDAEAKTTADILSDKEAKAAEKAKRDKATAEIEANEKKDKENALLAQGALARANLDPDNKALYSKAFTMAQGGNTSEAIFNYFDAGIRDGSIQVLSQKMGPLPGISSNTVLSKYEAGSGGPNALLNQSQNSQFSDINVSTMPISEVMNFQAKRGDGSYHAWSKTNMPKNTQAYKSGLGSTPVGSFQFVGETLQELKTNGTFEALGITDDTVFDQETQEALFVRYAQDSLKGKVTPEERRAELRAKWEGLRNASDEEVDSVIASIETGTFSSDGVEIEGSRNDPKYGLNAEVTFNAPTEDFDELDISSIKSVKDWEAANANLEANPKRLRPEFQKIFEARGDNLKLLQTTNRVEDLFSIDLITADTMTAQKLQERINLAEAKEMVVPQEVKNYVEILEGKSDYSDKDILSMSAAERTLVAKFAKNTETRDFALRVNQNDVEAFTWISEASSNSASARAKAKEFFAAGDLANFNLASNIAISLENDELPYKNLIKIDNLVGKGLTDLRSIKRLAIQGGATPEELTSLQGELDRAIELETNGEYRKYAEKATTLKTASGQLSIAIREGASIETLSGLKQLEATLRRQEETKADIDKFGFGVIPEDAVITLADGTLKYSTVYRKPGEKGVINRAGESVNAMPMGPAELDAYKTIRTETQKIGHELALANTAITEGMRTSISAIELVRGDERVRNAGGAVAGLIRNVVAGGGGLFSVAEELFKTQDTVTIEDLQKDSSFSNEILDAVLSGDVQNLANETARFQAKMLSLAFQVGRMEGQSGNAMSNQDFRKIMEIVNTAGGAEAFEKNLIDYMGSKIQSYDDKAVGLVNINTNVSTFKADYGYLPIAAPLTFKEFVDLRNDPQLTSAFNIFSGAEIEVTARPPKPQSNDGLPVPTTKEQRDALSNTWYVTPDGSLAWKGN